MTLRELERECAEARRLGLEDDSQVEINTGLVPWKRWGPRNYETNLPTVSHTVVLRHRTGDSLLLQPQHSPIRICKDRFCSCCREVRKARHAHAQQLVELRKDLRFQALRRRNWSGRRKGPLAVLNLGEAGRGELQL